MKRILLFSAVALLAVSLTACGGPASSGPSQSTGAPASSAVSEAASSAPDSPASAPADDPRPEHTELEIWVEGEIEQVPASLFRGEGYSIYLPDDQWVQTACASPDQPEYADVFTAAVNENVTLSIRPNRTGLDLGQAYDALLSEGYLQSDDEDALFGRSADGIAECIHAFEQGGRVWYVSWAYPDTPEYIEGWGSRLPQIAATFTTE